MSTSSTAHAEPAEYEAVSPESVDYVVISYRSERHLAACLDAIQGDRPAHAGIIVIDNSSTDGSVAVAQRHASQPRVESNTRNLGFGAACNHGAQLSNADLLFFVNPDARIRRGVTSELAGAIRADPSVVACGPRILGPRGDLAAASAGFEPTLRSVAGHFLGLGRVPWVRRWFAPLQLPPGTQRQRVDWVSGAALMVSSAAFRRVAGFDSSMFLYMEDVDLCRRLREQGGVIEYHPSGVVEHDLGGSQGTEQAERWYDAFHDYVGQRHGRAYARLVSAIAALGLVMRAAAGLGRGSEYRRRMARASLTAARRAIGLHGSTSKSAPT